MSAKILYSLIALFMIGLAGCGGKTPPPPPPPEEKNCRDMNDGPSCADVKKQDGTDKCDFLDNGYCVDKDRNTNVCTDVPDADAVKYCAVPGYVRTQNCVELNGKCQKKPETQALKDFRTAVGALALGFDLTDVKAKLDAIQDAEEKKSLFNDFDQGQNIFHVLLSKDLLKDTNFKPLIDFVIAVNNAEANLALERQRPSDNKSPVTLYVEKAIEAKDSNLIKTPKLTIDVANENLGGVGVNILDMALEKLDPKVAADKKFITELVAYLKPAKSDAQWEAFAEKAKIAALAKMNNNKQNVMALLKVVIADLKKAAIEAVEKKANVKAAIDALLAGDPLDIEQFIETKIDGNNILFSIAALPASVDNKDAFLALLNNQYSSPKIKFEDKTRFGRTMLQILMADNFTRTGPDDKSSLRAMIQAFITKAPDSAIAALTKDLVMGALRKSGDVFATGPLSSAKIDAKGIDALRDVIGTFGKDLRIKAELFKPNYPKFTDKFVDGPIPLQVALRVGTGKTSGTLKTGQPNRVPFEKLIIDYRALEADFNAWKTFAEPIANNGDFIAVVDNANDAKAIMLVTSATAGLDKIFAPPAGGGLDTFNAQVAKSAFDAFVAANAGTPNVVTDFVNANIINVINRLPDPANPEFALLIKEMVKKVGALPALDAVQSQHLIRDIQDDNDALAKVYAQATCAQGDLLKELSKNVYEQKANVAIVDAWKALVNACHATQPVMVNEMRGELFNVAYAAALNKAKAALLPGGFFTWSLLGEEVVKELITGDTFGLVAGGANLKDANYKIGQMVGPLLYVMIKKVTVEVGPTKKEKIDALEPVITAIRPSMGDEAQYGTYITTNFKDEANADQTIIQAMGILPTDANEARYLLKAHSGVTAAGVNAKVATAIVPGSDQTEFDWLLKAYMDQTANPTTTLQQKVTALIAPVAGNQEQFIYMAKKLLALDVITPANAATANIFTPAVSVNNKGKYAGALFVELPDTSLEKLEVMFNAIFTPAGGPDKIALKNALVREVYEQEEINLGFLNPDKTKVVGKVLTADQQKAILDLVAELIRSNMIGPSSADKDQANKAWAVTANFNPFDKTYDSGAPINNWTVLQHIIFQFRFHEKFDLTQANVQQLAQALRARVVDNGGNWDTYLSNGGANSVLDLYIQPGKAWTVPGVTRDNLKIWFNP